MRVLSAIASATVLLVLAAAPAALADFTRGFNIAANNPDGSCKSEADWRFAFDQLKGLPGGAFGNARLYASSDCNTLASAVPAAVAAGGVKIMVGVWTEDETHFTAEKNALEAAIRQFGPDWILAVSVGSEDLYRKEADPNRLAQQIYDVRGMVRALGVNADVGHVDTWTAWVDGANGVVITASDFVGMDGYPYFQGSTIEDSANVFWQSLQATKDAVGRDKPGTAVWVTETSWPVSGNNFGAAVPSVQNAETYWKNVGCALFSQANTFWYAYQDFNANPSFGIFAQNQQPAYDLSC